MDLKQKFAEILADQLNEFLTLDEIEKLIETPKNSSFGDLAFPCFTLAKNLRKAPNLIAEELTEKLKDRHEFIAKAEAVGPYLNVFLSKEPIAKEVITNVLNEGAQYGNQPDHGKTVVLDYSSPNIAKPFSMGHLRSTVIGNALANIAEKNGYKTVRINYLGDWGTQFGKLIAAYKRWGDEEKVRVNPIEELFTLYKKFHVEVEKHPELDEEGRAWFKKLEEGDEEATYLWKWFRDESLKEFNKIYQLLGIEFDSYNGEAFYNDKMDPVVDELKAKNLLEESEGAEVVRLDEEDLPPCLIKKSDGASLYATRDITAAIYRQNTYHFDTALYVFGAEQSLHFKQFQTVLKKMGYEWANNMHHIQFGLYLQDGKKMSTRKGRVILLEQVLEEAIELAEKNIEAKNPSLENKSEVAKQVGVGAVIFHDLKNHRMNNIEFSLDEMLTFEGETGPYVQYTYARAQSILRKAKTISQDFVVKDVDESAWELVKLLNEFSNRIQYAWSSFDPSIIAKYVIDLAQAFNKYYGKVRILEENDGLGFRLALVETVSIVLKEGLQLLGVSAPQEM